MIVRVLKLRISFFSTNQRTTFEHQFVQTDSRDTWKRMTIFILKFQLVPLALKFQLVSLPLKFEVLTLLLKLDKREKYES